MKNIIDITTKKNIDIPTIHEQKPIKEGSKVVFVDGSYTLSINANSKQMRHEFVGLSDDIWTVVAVNVECPTENTDTGSLAYRNNCIVKNDRGDICFCSKINIRNIERIF